MPLSTETLPEDRLMFMLFFGERCCCWFCCLSKGSSSENSIILNNCKTNWCKGGGEVKAIPSALPSPFRLGDQVLSLWQTSLLYCVSTRREGSNSAGFMEKRRNVSIEEDMFRKSPSPFSEISEGTVRRGAAWCAEGCGGLAPVSRPQCCGRETVTGLPAPHTSCGAAQMIFL